MSEYAEAIMVKCSPTSPRVMEIADRLNGVPEDPQTVMDLLALAAMLSIELECEPGSFEAMSSAVQESFKGGGFPL